MVMRANFPNNDILTNEWLSIIALN
jgi:hypothetical protein